MEIGGCAQELSDVACDDARTRGEAFPATFGEPTRNEEVRCQPEEQTVKYTGLTPSAPCMRTEVRAPSLPTSKTPRNFCPVPLTIPHHEPRPNLAAHRRFCPRHPGF